VIVIGIPTRVRVVDGAAVMTVALDKQNRADVVVPSSDVIDAWRDPEAFAASWTRLIASTGPWSWAVEVERDGDTVRWHGWMDLGHDADLEQAMTAARTEGA
jgi:hypothetical protein